MIHLALLLLGAQAPVEACPVLGPPVGPHPAPALLQSDDEHATEWPTTKDIEALKLAVRQVHKATSKEMEALGQATIEETGAAAAPLLLKALERETDKDAIARVSAALDTVTKPVHTRLLAASFEVESAPLRRYALVRVATLGDTGLRKPVEALMGSFEKRLESKKRKQRVEEEDLDLAALLAMSTGSVKGIERSISVAGAKGWSDRREALRAASLSAKSAGDDVADALAAALKPGVKSKDRVAILRLLTFAGTEKQARAVMPSLDANANNVKVAAVNALRMMVDGDPPLEKLSTFDAIERAQKWKKRL